VADSIFYFDESEDEMAYDQGAAFFIALLGLDADLATFSLPANVSIANAASGFTMTANSIAIAVEAASTINQDLSSDASPTFNQGNFTTVHTTTILADHVGEHTGAHGIILDNDLTRIGIIKVDHIAEATGAHGVVFDHAPQATTIKLTNLTDDYIPYHVDDSTGLANGPTKTNVDSAVSLKHTQHTDTGTTGNTFTVDSDSTTGKIIIDVALDAADKSLTLTNAALTGDRVITFPDATGTVTLTTLATDTLWDAAGDLVVGSGANTAGRLAKGNNDEVLTMVAGAVAWAAAGAGSGNVATDTIWDAKGDLAVGTGPNTAAKLTVGTDGKFLKAASGEATGLIWDTPAGTGDFKADGSVPLTGDIDFAGSYQCHDLQAPSASGEAIRATGTITETNLTDLTDGGATTLHSHAGGGGDTFLVTQVFS
jgi:hypothetical protein